jgi:hypothetical protein
MERAAVNAPEPDSGRPRPQQVERPTGIISALRWSSFSLSHRMGEGRGEGRLQGKNSPSRSRTAPRTANVAPTFSLSSPNEERAGACRAVAQRRRMRSLRVLGEIWPLPRGFVGSLQVRRETRIGAMNREAYGRARQRLGPRQVRVGGTRRFGLRGSFVQCSVFDVPGFMERGTALND